MVQVFVHPYYQCLLQTNKTPNETSCKAFDKSLSRASNLLKLRNDKGNTAHTKHLVGFITNDLYIQFPLDELNVHKLLKAKVQVKLSDLVISAEVDQLKTFRINENKLVTADLSINFLKNKFELFSEMCEWFLKQN